MQIIHALDTRPRNASQLAAHLNLNEDTVRHHLAVLTEHGLVHESNEEYGGVYLLTDQTRHHWKLIETITQQRRSPLIDHGVK